jgi:CheY-like chemotaxis protein
LDRARAKNAGFAEHLTKPVDGGRLLEALDAAGSEPAGALGLA